MTTQAKMIAHSISAAGVDLATIEVTYPLIIHNEGLTHRMNARSDSQQFEEWLTTQLDPNGVLKLFDDTGTFDQYLEFSRSASSNRALAPAKLREEVLRNPYVPQFRYATRGMVPGDVVNADNQALFAYGWLKARDDAVKWFDYYDTLPGRVHKQWRNRLLIPWQYITVVFTANGLMWQHFFALRDHPEAQDELRNAAHLARREYEASTPKLRTVHAPYVSDAEVALMSHEQRKRVSIARCARSSYLRQGEKLEIGADLELFTRLYVRRSDSNSPPHAAPAEHYAVAHDNPAHRSGNFFGWEQERKVMGL